MLYVCTGVLSSSILWHSARKDEPALLSRSTEVARIQKASKHEIEANTHTCVSRHLAAFCYLKMPSGAHPFTALLSGNRTVGANIPTDEARDSVVGHVARAVQDVLLEMITIVHGACLAPGNGFNTASFRAEELFKVNPRN